MKLKSLAAVAVFAAAVALGARIAYAFLGGVVVNGSFAGNEVIPIYLGSGVASLGAVVTYSSPSFSAATFSTGQVSTGSLTITSNPLLSTAAATESIVVNSTSGALGDFVSLSCPIQPGSVVAKVNRDWIYGPTVSSSAINLAAALTRRGACLGGVQFIASANVVYATAPVGALYNNIKVVTNDATTLTVSSATFLGGRDSAVVALNGTGFKANRDYVVGASSGTSATNLATAINASVPLNTFVTATAGSGATLGVVTFQSKNSGALYNFPLTTSNSAAVSVFAPNLFGGVTTPWVAGGKVINVPNHGFVTGLPILYSVGTSPAITGLTSQTTYYVGVVDANDVSLSTTRANALAGTFITLGSSSTATTASNYSLFPENFVTGSAGFAWDVSNDGNTWVALSNTSSFTYVSPGSSIWSFGALPYKYLGLNFTAPTQGAITLTVNAQGQ